MFLEVKNVAVKYGKAIAVENASLCVEQGEIVSIIGANGAGKTTLINTICGHLHPATGEIWFDGTRMDKMSAASAVKQGLVQVPAGRHIFGQMSVRDNLLVGAFQRRDREQIKKDLEYIYEHFPILNERRNQDGGSLSGGEQQMLAVGRALMAKPRLLLMDEPSVGLSPIMVNEVKEIIRQINAMGISILLVEQNSRMALKLSTRAYVLELGNIVKEGPSEQLLNDPDIKKYYLGG